MVAAREDALLFETAPLVKDRERLRRILEHLSLIFRDACVRRAGGTSMVSGQWGSVSTLCQNATRKQLLAMLEVCEQWKGFSFVQREYGSLSDRPLYPSAAGGRQIAGDLGSSERLNLRWEEV